MKLSLSKGSLLPLAVGASVGLLFGVGILVGTLVTQQQSNGLNTAKATRTGELPLQAAGATVGSHISMATGQIDADIEGVFVLDHQTGQLTCWVLNPRGLAGARGIIGKFTYNVLSDLGLERGQRSRLCSDDRRHQCSWWSWRQASQLGRLRCRWEHGRRCWLCRNVEPRFGRHGHSASRTSRPSDGRQGPPKHRPRISSLPLPKQSNGTRSQTCGRVASCARHSPRRLEVADDWSPCGSHIAVLECGFGVSTPLSYKPIDCEDCLQRTTARGFGKHHRRATAGTVGGIGEARRCRGEFGTRTSRFTRRCHVTRR